MHQYLVTGPGSFPSDMLRYDKAKIIGVGTFLGKPAYVIESKREATVERWRSFLWAVWPVEIVRPHDDGALVKIRHLTGTAEWLNVEPYREGPLLSA